MNGMFVSYRGGAANVLHFGISCFGKEVGRGKGYR